MVRVSFTAEQKGHPARCLGRRINVDTCCVVQSSDATLIAPPLAPPSGDGLSGGAIAGIATAASALFLALLALAAVLLWRHRWPQRRCNVDSASVSDGDRTSSSDATHRGGWWWRWRPKTKSNAQAQHSIGSSASCRQRDSYRGAHGVVHPHRTGANGNNRVGARPPHKQRIGLSSYIQHTDNPLATETIPEEDEDDLEDTGSDIVGFDNESHSLLPQRVQLEDVTPVASFYTASSKSPSPDSALQHSFERSTELDEAPVLRAPSSASTSSSTSNGKAAERAAASGAPRITIADRERSFEALSAAGDPFGAQLLPCAGLKDAYSSYGSCTCLR